MGPRRKFQSSGEYWDQRYARGQTSGYGSYGKVAEFKARILNDFVASQGVKSVIEYGCGDANQLKYARYPSYVGFDVSPKAIEICRGTFSADSNKAFKLVSDYAGERADLTLSLEVVFHMVEDEVFGDYMARLFDSADRFVIVYASNFDSPPGSTAPHVRHRQFSRWIGENRPDWKQIQHLANPFRPAQEASVPSAYLNDFYIYSR